jgi:hypothetical protein
MNEIENIKDNDKNNQLPIGNEAERTASEEVATTRPQTNNDPINKKQDQLIKNIQKEFIERKAGRACYLMDHRRGKIILRFMPTPAAGWLPGSFLF